MLPILSEHTCLILHAYVIWMKLQFRFNWSVMPGNYYCCAQDVRSELFNGKAHIFFSIIFLNLLDSMSNWWPISNLSKLLQAALTMQFRIALNEAGSWQWMHLSLTLIVLNLIHSLAFFFISWCQCVCQTLLNVPNRCPLQCPIFSRATCPCWWRWSVWTTLHRFPTLCWLAVLWWGCTWAREWKSSVQWQLLNVSDRMVTAA